MARERSIVVRLKAEVDGFRNAMGQASRSLSDFEREQQKLGGAANTTMGRLVQSAKINEREWTNVGRTMLTAGAGMAAIGGAALKAGIDYNSLRQTATKSLESVTGSTEAAATQMQRLDDYGKNSWLMRDVLIRAQQHMTGFGIETSKAIPYMDALAEAVAGTTGSQQNFEELARLMGQVESQSKITARELNQFGIRGIDAAQLIGDAMGKTAQEIREQITAGTLDAGDALDALAEGMMNTYEGSSDRLRDTWQGAFDNLKAAWRDLGAEFAKPLVNPEGGGFLVDLTNHVADFLNALQDLPGPVKTATGVIGGLTTAALVGGGSLLMAAPKYFKFKDDLQTLANTHPSVAKLSGALGKLRNAAAIGAVATTAAVGLLKLADAFRDSGIPANANRIVSAFSEINGLDVDTLFLEATAGSRGFNDALENLLDLPFGHEWGMSIAETIGITSNASLNAKQTFEEMDATLASMVDGGQPDKAAQLFEILTEKLDTTRFSVEDLEGMFPGYQDALDAAAADTEIASEATEQLATSMANLGSSAEESEDIMQSWISTMQEAGGSFGGIIDAFDAVIEKNEDLKLSSSQTMEQWIEQMEKQAKAVKNWRDNTITAMDQIREDVPKSAQEAHLGFVKEMVEAGESGAEALQTFVDGTPEQRQELVDAWSETGPAINDVIEAGLEPVSVEGDTEPLEAAFGDVVDLIESAFPETSVDADVSPARGSFNSETGLWESTTTDTNLDANIIPAEATSRGLIDAWRGTTTDTNLDANTTPAAGSFNTITGQWMGQTTDTNLDANTSPAQGSFNSLTGTFRNTTTSTNVDANTQPARNAVSNLQAWFAGLKFTKTVSVIEKPGKFDGGWINPGRYEGGTVQPGLNAGGWVPGERAGYDNVLWPLHSGGQVLAQPLEGREFVVNSHDAARYPAELNAMNSGTYPTGMLEQAYSPTSSGNITVTAPPVDTSGIREEVRAGLAGATITFQMGNQQVSAMIEGAQHSAARGRPAFPFAQSSNR